MVYSSPLIRSPYLPRIFLVTLDMWPLVRGRSECNNCISSRKVLVTIGRVASVQSGHWEREHYRYSVNSKYGIHVKQSFRDLWNLTPLSYLIRTYSALKYDHIHEVPGSTFSRWFSTLRCWRLFNRWSRNIFVLLVNKSIVRTVDWKSLWDSYKLVSAVR